LSILRRAAAPASSRDPLNLTTVGLLSGTPPALAKRRGSVALFHKPPMAERGAARATWAAGRVFRAMKTPPSLAAVAGSSGSPSASVRCCVGRATRLHSGHTQVWRRGVPVWLRAKLLEMLRARHTRSPAGTCWIAAGLGLRLMRLNERIDHRRDRVRACLHDGLQGHRLELDGLALYTLDRRFIGFMIYDPRTMRFEGCYPHWPLQRK
jgi:hypothetical protein